MTKQMVKKFIIYVFGSKNSERLLRIWRYANRKIQSYKALIMKKIYPPNAKERYLNIGGGDWYYPRWENVDFYADEALVDYRIDLRLKRPIGLPDGCAKLIFCSHLLEHVSDDACLFILRECYRLLKAGGVMRISVPDMDKALEAYQANNHDFFDEGSVRIAGDSIERKLVNFFASYSKDGYDGGPIVSPEQVREKLQSLDKYEFVNWCVSLIPEDAPYKAHVNGYDFEKLKSLIKNAGFSRVVSSEYRSSSVPTLRVRAFDNRPLVSLFIEAFK